MAMIPSEDELLAQQLVAGLLDEELSFTAAKAVQLHFILQNSALKGKRHARRDLETSQMAVNEARAGVEFAVVQYIHSHGSAQTATDRQHAMRIAATKRRT
jgi:hypothetical protein